jgi:hypothetical protein
MTIRRTVIPLQLPQPSPAMNRTNILYAIIAVLAVAVGVVSFALYQARQEPPGLHIDVGPKGLSIEKK